MLYMHEGEADEKTKRGTLKAQERSTMGKSRVKCNNRIGLDFSVYTTEYINTVKKHDILVKY